MGVVTSRFLSKTCQQNNTNMVQTWCLTMSRSFQFCLVYIFFAFFCCVFWNWYICSMRHQNHDVSNMTSIPGLTIQCGSTSSRPKGAVSLVSGRHATMQPGKVTGGLSMADMAGIGWQVYAMFEKRCKHQHVAPHSERTSQSALDLFLFKSYQIL